MYRIPVLAVALFAPVVSAAEVKTIRAPAGALVPEVALGGDGVVHMVYGVKQSGNAFYLNSSDGGKTFTTPVQLNRRPDTVTIGMERGPKLALGKDGSIHIVWLGYYQRGGGVWYTRSTDGGKSFEEERALTEVRPAWDNATVAADGEGNVVVLYTGQWPGMKEDPKSPAASPIILQRSTDNGGTFQKPALVKHNYPGPACGCCRLNAEMTGDGMLYIGFRGGSQSIRDPWLLWGKKTENDFKAVPISADNWHFTCPMSGVPVQAGANGRVLAAWMNQDRVYWAISDERAGKFSTRIAAPAGQKQSGPLALRNAQGDILLVYKDGSDVTYALYTAEGKLESTKKVGRLPGSEKATAFVGAGGAFYVVY